MWINDGLKAMACSAIIVLENAVLWAVTMGCNGIDLYNGHIMRLLHTHIVMKPLLFPLYKAVHSPYRRNRYQPSWHGRKVYLSEMSNFCMRCSWFYWLVCCWCIEVQGVSMDHKSSTCVFFNRFVMVKMSQLHIV